MPITLTSRYKPLTYDEITRPLIEQTAAQESLENAYVEAQTQAAQLQAQANEQTDPIAYARLNSYATMLQQQADNLMRQGLNRNSRTSLLNTRKRYNQDIVPVQNAVARRNQLMEERHQLYQQHPDLLAERDVISLDELLQNPQADLGRIASGNDITKRVGTAVAAAARGIQSIRLGQNLDRYTQTVIQQSGFTIEQIQDAIARGADDQSILSTIRDGVLNSMGIADWNNPDAYNRAIDYANEGYYQGILGTQIGTQEDFGAREALRHQHRMAEMAEEYRLKDLYSRMSAASQGQGGLGGWIPDEEAVLEANGKQGEINTTISQLIDLETGKGLPAYFGADGTVNPLKVYEDYQARLAELNAEEQQSLADQKHEAIVNKHQVNATETAAIRDGYRKAKADALSEILAKYGVTSLITKDQYDNLRLIGYDNSSTNMGEAGNVMSYANNASKEYTMSGIGMKNLGTHAVTDNFQVNNKKAKNAGTAKTRVHTYDPYTNTEGKGVELGDDVKIHNIQYYAKNPKKLIITTSDGGTYAVDPSMINSTVANIVNNAAKALDNPELSSYDRQVIQLSTARNIYLAINAYNPEAGSTLSPQKFDDYE